jgi:hypothetical protein
MPVRRTALLATVVLLISTVGFAQQIQGDYLETRSADVYTGQCFANGEVNLVGNQAILAWHVRRGSWDGVRLDGLSIAAAVRARGTLGDPYENPYPAQAVLIVDEQASGAQRTALIAFAQQTGGELLRHVEKVVSAPVEMIVNPRRQGAALLRAGEFATVQTRSLNDSDHICGNEVTFYPPLTDLVHSMPVVAVTDAYRGPGLGVDWESHGKRSAFLGSFAR